MLPMRSLLISDSKTEKKDEIFFNFILYKFAGFEFVCIFASLNKKAQMAKLVDALVSGTSVLTDVQVRVLFWAPLKY